jgi:uncharacterized membrane protein SpoIIM required for sporulation
MPEKLIDQRHAEWRRLEELILVAGNRRGLARLSRSELRELGRIYRQAATDLAIARVESRDQRVVDYLNTLLIRAHGIIYQTESSGFGAIGQFFRSDFPAIFRQTIAYSGTAMVIFILLAAFSFMATFRNEDFADFSYLSPALIQQIKSRQAWWETLNAEAATGAAEIIFNNTQIGLLAFALSIFPVAGTIRVLMPTALMFGSINALIMKYGMTRELWSFMAAHMVLEFAAIFISSGAGLMLGMAVLLPGERTRSEALIERGRLAIKLLVGCLPLFLLAGLIEGFLSPLPIHTGFKIAASLMTAGLLAGYLNSRPPGQ